jgi:hypothetical protein
VKPRLAITARQLRALHRVVYSLRLGGAHISVTGANDLLSDKEMTDLENRLAEAVREEPDVEVRIDW